MYSQAQNTQLLGPSGLDHMRTTLSLGQQEKIFRKNFKNGPSQSSLFYLGLGFGMIAFGKFLRRLSYQS
jgi:hypothetical protein